MSLRQRPRVSARMIAAKRANARKSTGPRRKARVTLNALKHRGYAGRLFVGIRIHIPKTGIRLHFWVRSRRMVAAPGPYRLSKSPWRAGYPLDSGNHNGLWSGDNWAWLAACLTCEYK